MADVKVPLSSKAIVTTMLSSEWIAVRTAAGIRQITAANLGTVIGGLYKGTVADDAALTALSIGNLITGEARFNVAAGKFYVWVADMTSGTASNYYDTFEPDDKAVANGFWVAEDSRLPSASVITPLATQNLNWSPNTYWTLNNTIGGGITLTLTGVQDVGGKMSYLQVTTNGNALTLSGVTVDGGAYDSGQTTQTLEFYKAGGITRGRWSDSAYVLP